MDINEYLDNAVDVLKAELQGVRVVKAYPNRFKPTRQSVPIIAVSLGGADSKSIGISGYAQEDEIELDIMSYVSYDDGIDTLCSIANMVRESSILTQSTSFSISAIDNNDTTDTLGLKMTVKYRSYDINGE